MQSNNLTSTHDEGVDWPQQPPGILIMGKRQGTKKENKQLRGRAAMAAALWYSAPQPKPYLIFVASDIHGPNRTPDAEVVKYLLTEGFGIPADFLIFRQKTNCTLLEVRAAKAISRVYRLSHIFAVTHLYHAPRTQRYINEVLKDASVIPVHLDILEEIAFPAEAQDLLKELQAIIEASLPNSLDVLREHLIEWFLERAHGLDRRGRFERHLARILRPGAYR
jgi:hypothetical protein